MRLINSGLTIVWLTIRFRSRALRQSGLLRGNRGAYRRSIKLVERIDFFFRISLQPSIDRCVYH